MFDEIKKDGSKKCGDEEVLGDDKLKDLITNVGNDHNLRVCGKQMTFKADPSIKPTPVNALSLKKRDIVKRGFGGFLLNLFLTLLQVAALAAIIILIIAIFAVYGTVIGIVTVGVVIFIITIALLVSGIVGSAKGMARSFVN